MHSVKHAHLAVPVNPGHLGAQGTWQYLRYLVVAVGFLAAYEYSPGLFAVLAIFGGLVLALRQRIERLERVTTPVAPFARRFVRGDGGSSPGTGPSVKGAPAAHVVVVDGGSLENHHA